MLVEALDLVLVLPEKPDLVALKSWQALGLRTLGCADALTRHQPLGLELARPVAKGELGRVHLALLWKRPEAAVLVAPLERMPPSPGRLVPLVEAGADVVLQRPQQLIPGLYSSRCLKPVERAIRKGVDDLALALKGLKLQQGL